METSIKNSLDAVTLLATASSYTDEVRRDSIADKLPSDIKNCINSTEPNHASDTRLERKTCALPRLIFSKSDWLLGYIPSEARI